MHIVDKENNRTYISGHLHLADGFQTWEPQTRLPRHRHVSAYATIVVSGGFRECGNWGRFHVAPGDVLIHKAFDTHSNEIFVAGSKVIHLELDGLEFTAGAFGYIRDLDAFVRVATSDIHQARALLAKEFVRASAVARDWPDILAADLTEDPNCRLEEWADEHNLAHETLSRGFDRAFGVAPAVFRSEARARRAFEQIAQGAPFLNEVCETVGFSDQAHMCRAVKSLTGDTPFNWLRRITRGRRIAPPVGLRMG